VVRDNHTLRMRILPRATSSPSAPLPPISPRLRRRRGASLTALLPRWHPRAGDPGTRATQRRSCPCQAPGAAA
jgi:hypothetical protein